VLVVPGRAGRPGATGRTTRVGDAATCPFCGGHEQMTPPEVAALGRREGPPDSPGWLVRVVPNKYPAFPGHEVVVHGPEHVISLGDLAPGLLETVVSAWRQRREAHAGLGTGHLLVAINEGAAAGASLDHSHSQLVPFDRAPPLIEREAAAFRDGCPLCLPLDNVVRRGEGLVTFCPAWSRLPYETWITPETHAATAPLDDAIATALADAVGRLRRLLGSDLAWNAVLHESSPASGAPFHWHVELLPRLTVQASVELGAGIWVNMVDPARAAGELAEAG
jgi:UDPglucose--hexose-1-phosphate uridylyltransferase